MTAAPATSDVRAQILEAATRLFAARGFEATPLQAVAEAVGIRKQSLLYHFPSKEALRAAVLEQLLSRWNEVLPRLLMVAAEGEQIFDAVMQEVLAFFAADTDRARLLLREILDRPDEMRTLLLGDGQRWLDVLARSLRKGQELGTVRADVEPRTYLLEVALLLLVGLATDDAVNGLLSAAGDGHDDGSRHELVRIARTSLFLPDPETRR